MAKKSPSETVTHILGDKSKFNLAAFKKSKYLDQTTKFKEQKWIPFTPAVKEALSIPGVPMG